MFLLLLPAVLCCLMLVRGQDTQRVVDAFTQDAVVPDVIPTFSPLATLSVVFTDSAMQQVNITPGMNLTTAQTASEPQFFLDIANATLANSTFVIAMVDPDAPTPQNTSISQVRHMLGGGFQRDPTTGMLSNTTAALSDYIPPAPPAGSDAHRYVILVFNQSSAFMENAPPFVAATPDRLNFNLTQFVESVQLGTPIAGNFFFTAPDNSTSTSTSAAASTPLSTAVTNGVTSYPAAATTAPGSDTSGALKMDQGFRAFLVLCISVSVVLLL